MYLCIDNSKTEKNVFFVSKDGSSWRTHEFDASGEGSLQRDLEKVLIVEKAELSAIKGIAVRVGVGKFTATRLAVTFANTLAYSLRVPVVAEKDIDLSTIAKIMESAPVGRYALASYSAEPRIGKKE
jgi:hypothetical protein